MSWYYVLYFSFSFRPSFFFFSCSRPHRSLHSFPTRRSSDLAVLDDPRIFPAVAARYGIDAATAGKIRSEEHTSELQSHHDLVCRLLLEKKKIKCRWNLPNVVSPNCRSFSTYLYRFCGTFICS